MILRAFEHALSYAIALEEDQIQDLVHLQVTSFEASHADNLQFAKMLDAQERLLRGLASRLLLLIDCLEFLGSGACLSH